MKSMATETKKQAEVKDLELTQDVQGGAGVRFADKDGNTGANLILR